VTIHSAPRVSIIIRTIPGREHFLREALASVAAQTFTDVEVVVVADGGDGVAAAVVIEAVAGGIKARYQAYPKQGRSLTGNAGLALAQGEYCGFLDDDDQLLPQHLAQLVPVLDAHPATPAAYAIAALRSTTVHSLNPLSYTEGPSRIVYPATLPFWPTVLTRNILPIQTVLFRRALFLRHGGFNAGLDYYEDWDLWLRYAQEGPFRCVPEVTSFYRLFPSRETPAARFRTAEGYLPQVLAASADYRWTLTLADLRALDAAVVNRRRLRETVYRWIYCSPVRARMWEVLKLLRQWRD
jgi:glycosyltransferase involved in cell wall biosynthesis